MQTKRIKNVHVLKIQKGEMVLEEITKYVTRQQIGFAKFEGLGMVSGATFGFLNGADYVWKKWDETVELTMLIGNISWDNEERDKPIIHMHATIADKEYRSWGGHFGTAKVEGVVEIIITQISIEKLYKKHFGIVPFKTFDL